MYLFFDTETTGLPRDWNAPLSDVDNWPRLVQLGWMLYDGSHQLLSEANLIVQPEGFKIPAEVARIHGITHARALSQGLPLQEVLWRFEEDLARAGSVVAHNLDYDHKVLAAEYLRRSLPDPLGEKVRICTKEESTEWCALPGKRGYKWPTLQELHGKLFGHGFSGAHDALVDVRATARCFFELKLRGVVGKNM